MTAASAQNIPALVRRLRGGSRAAQADAACALSALAQEDDLFPALVEAGAIPATVQLLRHGSSATAEKAAMVVLANLGADSPENAAAALAAGAIPLLMQLLQNGTVDRQAMAAGVLNNLGRAPAARQAAAAAGAVPALLQALRRHGADVELTLRAALALKQLLLVELPVADICTAVRALTRLLRSSPSVEVQHAAVFGLSNAATLSSEARVAMAAAGAIPALLQHAVPQAGQLPTLDGQVPAIILAAMQALGHVAMGERERAAILADERGPAIFAVLQRRGIRQLQEVAELALAEAAAAQTAAAATDEPATDAAAPAADEQAQPAAEQHPQQRRRRSCAAPGCGATRGLRPCKGCLTARYCSPACQAAHWLEHKAECLRLREERAAAAAADEQVE